MAMAIHLELLRTAPTMGSVACKVASRSAETNANCPMVAGLGITLLLYADVDRLFWQGGVAAPKAQMSGCSDSKVRILRSRATTPALRATPPGQEGQLTGSL